MTENTALLIIDVQTGLFEEGAYKADDLLANVGSLTSQARKANVPVIYIQHAATHPDDSLHPDNPGHAIHPPIAPHQGELVVKKSVASGFEDTNLRQELESRGIKNLVIAGMQTDECVNATTRSAVQLGYDVTLVSDAHTTGDNGSTQQIIDQYNKDLSGIGAHLLTTDKVRFN
jgi:nicotinamidase-related amidase